MRVRVPPSAPFAALAALLALSLTAGCDRRDDSGPVVVSAIGGAPSLADPARTALDTPRRVLLDSVAQGLVQFDAAGQVEPALAERWIVTDEGRSYIFRIREAAWSDGRPITAGEIVRFLRHQTGPGSRNPLAPFLTAIDEIVEMTPQVIEVRLSRPRPDLLQLFAQPELAVFRLKPPGGSGPFRTSEAGRDGLLLRPATDTASDEADQPGQPSPEQQIFLIGESAARAVLRFTRGGSDLVSGGTAADWPLLEVARVDTASVRVDPAFGLFGLAVLNRTGFLSTAENRRAVSEAIDRSALVAGFATGWTPADRILPDGTDSASPAAVPGWVLLTQAERETDARGHVVAWPEPVTLRIALPAGSGATILFGRIAASLRRVGIGAERVGPGSAADLALLDKVAPYDSARWYLARACVQCGAEAQAALIAARDAPTLAARAQAIAAADFALDADVAFIPLARPLRWSLVSTRLDQWQPNARAWHPLNRLRTEPR